VALRTACNTTLASCERCLVNGEEATLLLSAPDYDGGKKALVRLDSGLETIVGRSCVERDS